MNNLLHSLYLQMNRFVTGIRTNLSWYRRYNYILKKYYKKSIEKINFVCFDSFYENPTLSLQKVFFCNITDKYQLNVHCTFLMKQKFCVFSSFIFILISIHISWLPITSQSHYHNLKMKAISEHRRLLLPLDLPC